MVHHKLDRFDTTPSHYYFIPSAPLVSSAFCTGYCYCPTLVAFSLLIFQTSQTCFAILLSSSWFWRKTADSNFLCSAIILSLLEITLCSQRCAYSQKVRSLCRTMSQIITKTEAKKKQNSIILLRKLKKSEILINFFILFNHWHQEDTHAQLFIQKYWL